MTHPFLFLTHSFANAVTWPIAALIAIGGGVALLKGRRDPSLWLCLFAFLAGLSMMTTIAGVTVVRQVRYFLGFLAVGQLLAGCAVAELLRRSGRGRSRVLAAVCALTANLGLAGATSAYNFYADSGDRSTHARAGAWIEAHVPAGSSIGLLRLPQPSNAPYFRYDRYDLRFAQSAEFFSTLPPSELPEYLATTSPDYDDRPAMEPNLSRYDLAAEFDRARLVPWIAIDPTATTANPRIDVYRLKR